MKFLHESLQATIRQTERSQLLHKAACNFVKKPGHVYHLYSRPSGQKYFSMLSPEVCFLTNFMEAYIFILFF